MLPYFIFILLLVTLHKEKEQVKEMIANNQLEKAIKTLKLLLATDKDQSITLLMNEQLLAEYKIKEGKRVQLVLPSFRFDHGADCV